MGISFPFLHQVLESGLLESLQDFRGRIFLLRGWNFRWDVMGLKGVSMGFHGSYRSLMGSKGVSWDVIRFKDIFFLVFLGHRIGSNWCTRIQLASMRYNGIQLNSSTVSFRFCWETGYPKIPWVKQHRSVPRKNDTN